LKDNKIKQKDFADDLGYSEENLSKIIRGDRPLNDIAINAIRFVMLMTEKVPKSDTEPLKKVLLEKWSKLSDTQKCQVIIYIENLTKGVI
jgi:hypothetical protein